MPTITAVTDDIYQIQIPLPFALRLVNCYLLHGDDGWTVVDTGLNTAAAREAWAAAFHELHITPDAIQQIVLTHTHPDHYGLAGWFCQQPPHPLPVYLSPEEDHAARTIWGTDLLLSDTYRDFWHNLGIPADLAANLMQATNDTRLQTFPHPATHSLIYPNTAVRLGNRLMRTIHTPGHSDGQLMFYDEADQLLLCGDHVLGKITPNISLWPGAMPNPLGAYLASLAELSHLPVRLALPGHGPLLTDWYGRIAQLTTHHAERLTFIEQAITKPMTIFAISQTLFNHSRLSLHEMRFAATETWAHVRYLLENGRLHSTSTTPWHITKP